MDWALYAWLKRGKRRRSILVEINKSKEPLSTNDLSIKQKIAISQASFTLGELEEKKLIVCLNPTDKIGKLYKIDKSGEEIIGGLKNG